MNTKLAYVRVSKADGEQTLDLQLDAMKEEGITSEYIYTITKFLAKESFRP